MGRTNDTYVNVNFGDLRHSALIVAVAAQGFANLDHLVDRTELRAPSRRRMGVYLDGNSITSLAGEEVLETVLDWSDDPDEAGRRALAEKRRQREA